jgi:hypothetical protein
MHRRLLAFALLLASPALAQQSENFTLEELTFNASGRPEQGETPASASFELSLDSIGESLGGGSTGSASFSLQLGFVVAYPPPTEVSGIRFVDAQQLIWDPEPSIGSYNLYRGPLIDLSGLGFGACLQQGLTTPGATDADALPPGSGFFYLATADNRLNEEGTKGFQSGGSERNGAVCP